MYVSQKTATSAVSSLFTRERKMTIAHNIEREHTIGRRTRHAGMLVCAVGFILLAAAPSAPAAEPGAESCPNAQFRTGYSGNLPDCRAYELVSPPGVEPFFNTGGTSGNVVTSGAVINGGVWGAQAAAEGDRLAFYSTFVPPSGSVSDGPYYLSTRGPDGWVTENTVPPQTTNNSGRTCFNAYPAIYSPNLEASIMADGWGQEGHPFNQVENDCGHDEPSLVAGEPQGVQNLFLRGGEPAAYELIDAAPMGTPNDAWFQGASEDLHHVVFSEEAELTPEAPAGEDLYDSSSGGAVRLVTILPDGEAVQGELAEADKPDPHLGGPGSEDFTHAVSADGSRVFFVAGGSLYVRENPEQPPHEECASAAKACTIQLDAAEAGASGPSGGGVFKWASVDGSRAFFTDENRLTANSTATAGAPDLYEYDLQAPVGQRLEDLTPDAGEAATVLGLSGASEDGSYVYFVADAALTGEQENSQAAKAQPGAPNLYLRHDGATTFIATLDPAGDTLDWAPSELTARTSPSGVFIAFNSIDRLTGYDNLDVGSGEPDQEIFLYDAATNELNCASCDPTGAQPTAPARIEHPVTKNLSVNLPSNLQRFVSERGQVFFNTSDRLPGATNGLPNVYEYEAGSIHLLSNGAGESPSYFYEASVSGDDVFLFTSDSPLPGHPSSGMSIYDARVDGGFSEPPAGPAACGESDCRAIAAAPALPAPGTMTLTGPVNLTPEAVKPAVKKKAAKCPKGKIRNKHDRCVKKAKPRKRLRRGRR
jgi:hypothetical protein